MHLRIGTFVPMDGAGPFIFYPGYIDIQFDPDKIRVPLFSTNHRAMPSTPSYTAFADTRRIASGTLADVAVAARRVLDRRPGAQILIFEDNSSRQAEVDLRGSADEVAARLQPAPRQPAAKSPRGPGRPRLGVVAREVTLLPRHWEWLGAQPGGASAALRRLVEEARRGNRAGERARQSSEAVYRFMHAMAGNRAGYEEALRAFYRGDRQQFDKRIARWPKDIREHASRLAAMAWDDGDDAR